MHVINLKENIVRKLISGLTDEEPLVSAFIQG